ncbi:RHS repeat-associated core domain-containing protein [Cellulomonas sp.]|uniref:RHS repeat-associated core domain-containing protein n=1 Tax=Cellulomonas sp. TaxID=40001 RepID=UPI003BACD816
MVARPCTANGAPRSARTDDDAGRPCERVLALLAAVVHLRARYYDPSTAQFLTIDPLYARTLSRYGYVSGNPLNGTDPSGLCSFWACVGIGAVVGAAVIGGLACIVAEPCGLVLAGVGATAAISAEAVVGVTAAGAVVGGSYAAGQALQAGESPGTMFSSGYSQSSYSRPSSSARSNTFQRQPKCAYCGKNNADTLDHIGSRKADWNNGGSTETKAARSDRVNDECNLTGACRSCNSSKQDRPLGEGEGEWWPQSWKPGEWWPYGQ